MGSALDVTAAHAAGSPEPGDRRIVTALFADLVDYVRMIAEHDPEEVRTRVTAALATMADSIERFDGTREKFIGDAVFAVFGWPQAHDDDAVRASLAAMAIRAGLHELADGGEPMEVRIGIATGEVVAGRPGAGGDLGLTGEAITTAARIQSLARPGEILLEGATLAASRGRLAVDDRGSVVLRGQSTPVNLHALRGEAGTGAWIPFRAAAPGPLVGRVHELSVLTNAIDRCRQTGRGSVIALVGEAGMGKSRLLAAAESHARAAGFAWTWTENVSYARGEPYRFARLFAQTVADEYGVDSGSLARRLLFTDDLEVEQARRWGGAIAAIARDAAFSGWEDQAAYMPNDPAEVATILLEVAATYVDRLLAESGPRVLVIDDLHWLDPSSAGLVELLAEATSSRPFIVLAGTRPTGIPAWVDRLKVERLELKGLAEPDTARLATLIARAAVEAEGVRSIHQRTAGNPLFIGETVRAFLEDGTLEWRDGRVTLVDSGPPRVPVTLRAVLGARIDGLEPAARDALGVASIIGITFAESLVEDLLGETLPPHTLDHLAEAALIHRGDDGEWRFAHALIRDAAHAGLLASRRRTLHAALADHLEARPRPVALGEIANHRVAAGDSARALPLLRDAAESALALGAPAEAASFWQQAAELSAVDDPAGAAGDRERAASALATASAASALGAP
ncbi:MAG TPA: adenylate/guanylate cyclase domain-containing protein [Methylomirabilota bacterium]|nr:adenylate/guanylate cyclase domain-containing protein [Methylomirabilota bacterium]